jgi:hypothetical protein
MKSIIMLGFLLSLLGCKSQENNNTGLSNEEQEKISKTIEDFKNRPIYKVLTTKIIDLTPDSTLLQVVFDNLIENLPKDYNKVYETVVSWNKSKQAIYLIWGLEAEVNNGGFNQYYYNSTGQFYKLVPDALNQVGAKLFSDLCKRANKIYEDENKKITKHIDGTIEGFSKSYQDNPLNKIDTEYYELYNKEDIEKIQIKYIRDNKKDFTND